MEKETLQKILEDHEKWLCGEDGKKANLSSADLRGADLRGADLSNTNLSYANLIDADLSYTNLIDADLSYADLRGAYLSYANLRDVKSNMGTTMYNSQCPEEGSYIAWKKCENNVLVKLLIPEDALRSSATSRKCRASKAIVLEIIGAEYAVSKHDSAFTYKVGETLEVEDFDINRWEECSTGIHHFITRSEAESY